MAYRGQHLHELEIILQGELDEALDVSQDALLIFCHQRTPPSTRQLRTVFVSQASHHPSRESGSTCVV